MKICNMSSDKADMGRLEHGAVIPADRERRRTGRQDRKASHIWGAFRVEAEYRKICWSHLMVRASAVPHPIQTHIVIWVPARWSQWTHEPTSL